MPAVYAKAFAAVEIAEHAMIAARRGERAVHAELCPSRADTLCIIADDRPGLLALVTDALLVQGLSVRSARAFCRKRSDGRSEAIDLFQLEPSGAASGDELELGPAELEELLQTLDDFVAEDARATSRVSAAPPSAGSPSRVYFEVAALCRGEYSLIVETPDCEGLLYAVTSALHEQGARIQACEIVTRDGTARDRFELATDASEPFDDVRLCDIQQAVLFALPRPSRSGAAPDRAALSAGRT